MPARIGVIGTGRWAAQHHIPALLANPRARLVAVADTNPDKLALIRRRFGVGHCFASAEDLCASGLVDGVVVSVPHASHYQVARLALEAGLHVLVEKPLTLDPGEAWDLVGRAQGNRRHLVVGYPFHFTRAVREARRLMVAGALGGLRLASGLFATPRAHLYRSRCPGSASLTVPDPGTYADPVLSGGGQGQTEATHALANMLYVTGADVAAVSAQMRQLDYPVDVVDVLALHFTDGAVGALATIGTISPEHPPQREFRYYGDHGMLLQDLTTGTLRGYLGRRRLAIGPDPAQSLYPAGAPSGCLVDLITGGGPNPAPADLGAAVVSCLAAAYESARRKGEPVPVMGP
jgi:predicted dehydrogenase